MVWISFFWPCSFGRQKASGGLLPSQGRVFFGGTGSNSCEPLLRSGLNCGGGAETRRARVLGMQVTSKARSRTAAGAGFRNSVRSGAKRTVAKRKERNSIQPNLVCLRSHAAVPHAKCSMVSAPTKTTRNAAQQLAIDVAGSEGGMSYVTAAREIT